ncbi:MAG TPA: adenine phosphoribosyltransferase [Bacteroidota bacterium]|jgi:adenine phosphoribosyltransferase|nr:adenine phosphoribosyltransferase [Bacteroidota bacterium]
MDLKNYIRNVLDFPKKGINFFDITTLLKDKDAFKVTCDLIYDNYKNIKIDKIVAPESRGFILGSVLAYKLNAGFVPVRKPGKLPAEKISKSYSLEYGTNTIEIHKDAILKGEKVLIHDDLLATGGTIKALIDLVEELGGEVVGLSFLIELSFLKGRSILNGYNIHSLLVYDSE